MAKKKNLAKRTPITPPVTSPFSSGRVEIELESAVLHVHRDFIADKSKLCALIVDSPVCTYGGYGMPMPTSTTSTTSTTSKLKLEDVSIEVGHTLVMWLYSGTYQLHQADTTPSQRLETASSLYSLARKFDLYGLEILAREQITQLSSQIDVFTVIDVIEEAYPCTIGEDEWLENFIAQQMEGALHGASYTSLSEPDTRADIPVSRLAFRALLKAFRGAMKDVIMAREGTPALAPGEVSCDDTKPRVETGDYGLLVDPKKKHTTPTQVEGADGELAGENFLNNHATILPKQRASAEPSTPLRDDDWDISIPRPEAEPEPAPVLEPGPLPEPEPKPMKEPAVEDYCWSFQSLRQKISEEEGKGCGGGGSA